jgi:hypothetical protein
MWPRSSRVGAAALLALIVTALLGAGRAAADITFQAQATNQGLSTTTLRVPATGGTFFVPNVPGGYLTVSVAISGLDHQVSAVRWSLTGSPTPQSFTRQSSRDSNTFVGTVDCRSEIWGLAAPALGAGSVTIDVAAVNPPAADPTLFATLIAYAHVAGTSVGGTCCANVTSDGSGTSTVTRTLPGLSHGDFLVDSVCEVWPQGDPAPGTPTSDVGANSELVTRGTTMAASPNLYAMVQTSGTSNIPAATKGSKTLQWSQSGTREWALSSLILLGQAPAPTDAGPAVGGDAAAADAALADAALADAALADAALADAAGRDASLVTDRPPATPDTAAAPAGDATPRTPDSAPPSSDGAMPAPDVAAPKLDTAALPLADGASSPPDGAGGPDAGAPPADASGSSGGDVGVASDVRPASSDSSAPAVVPDGGPPAPVTVNLRVGCACDVGGRSRGGGGLVLVLLAAASARRRRIRAPG